MSKTPFHLAWFVSKGYGPKAWRMPWGGPNPASWVKPDLFVALAQSLERAAFDYVMIEDSSNIPYTYKNSHDTYVRYAVDSPKLAARNGNGIPCQAARSPQSLLRTC